MADLCDHLRDAGTHALDAGGCEKCDQAGVKPVALRGCLTCGHVGCCDSTPGMHATEHFKETGHPVMQAIEPGQSWRWCYIDAQMAR
jgi:CPA1 family monovalent cation:H+ antiporter